MSAACSRDAAEVFRQALIDSCGERHYDYDYPEWYAGSVLAVLDRAGLTVARRPTETPQEGEGAEMNDFRAGYEFGYGDGQVGEYQPEKYRAAAKGPTEPQGGES